MLKERRTLVIVPRETPMSLPQLRNMVLCAEAGAMMLPAMPAFYQQPKTLHDLADFMAGKILSALGVEHAGPFQELGVLVGVDVVGDDGQLQLVAQGPAQGGHERGLAAADRAADADPERPSVTRQRDVPPKQRGARHRCRAAVPSRTGAGRAAVRRRRLTARRSRRPRA
jgi:hypothetical protein